MTLEITPFRAVATATALAAATLLSGCIDDALADNPNDSPQQAERDASINQNKALAGNVTPGDTPGFPITINQPGRYHLTSNLSAPADQSAIVIAPGVEAVIDLNGFTIAGPADCSKTVDCSKPAASGTAGVMVSNDASVQVTSGRVRGFTYAGIGGQGTSTIELESVRLFNNGSGTNGWRVMARHVVADGNAQYGIQVGYGSVVDSIASNNGGTGIGMNSGSIRGNVALANGGSGIGVAQVAYQDNSAWQNGSANIVSSNGAAAGSNNSAP